MAGGAKKARYFLLEKNCRLVKGARRGALYDLTGGDIYSIDEMDVPLLEGLEQYHPIDAVVSLVPGWESAAAYRYLRRLQELGLGRFRKIRRRQDKMPVEPPAHKIEFMWLELTRGCNLQCLHCSNDSGPGEIHTEVMGLEDWLRVLEEARQIGCRQVQFFGGEPFLVGDDLNELIRASRQMDYQLIEVFTNATLLTDERLAFLKAHGVQVAVSVYGKTPEVHDAVTQTPGSFKRTLGNLKKILAAQIPLRVAVVAMKQNQAHTAKTMRYLRKLGVSRISYDVVRAGGRGCDPGLVSEQLAASRQKQKPIFAKVDAETFALRRYGHPCFFGKVYIAADGNVLPCPMAKSLVTGNVRETSLAAVVQGDCFKDAWGLSKDKIEVCRDCEYRYGCFDCRPKVEGETGALDAKPPDCLYDPYLGEWRQPR